MKNENSQVGTVSSFIQTFTHTLSATYSSIKESITARFAPQENFLPDLDLDLDLMEYNERLPINPLYEVEDFVLTPEPQYNFKSPLALFVGTLLVTNAVMSNLPSSRYGRSAITMDRAAYSVWQPKVIGSAVLGTLMNAPSVVMATSMLPSASMSQTGGTDTRISNQTAGEQSVCFGGCHSLANLSGNRFVAAWREADSSELGIKAQIFNNDFTALGPTFQVNQYEQDFQVDPVVAVNSRDEMIFVWHSTGQDGSASGIYKRHFDSNGNPLTGDIQVNIATNGHQSGADIVINPYNDNYLIGWQSEETGDYNSFVRAYDSNHNPITSAIQLNTYITSNQLGQVLSRIDDNNTAAIWFSFDQDGSENGVYGRELDINYNFVTPEVQIHQNTTRPQHYASSARLTDGRIIVTWYSAHPSPTRTDIAARFFTSPLNATGPEFLINSMSNYSSSFPFALSLPNNNFAVFMQNSFDDGSGNGIFAQFFNGLAENISTVFQVNNYALGNQNYPAAILLGNGKIAVMWESDGQDGSGLGVYGTIIDPANYIVSVRTRSNGLTLMSTALFSSTPAPTPTSIPTSTTRTTPVPSSISLLTSSMFSLNSDSTARLSSDIQSTFAIVNPFEVGSINIINVELGIAYTLTTDDIMINFPSNNRHSVTFQVIDTNVGYTFMNQGQAVDLFTYADLQGGYIELLVDCASRAELTGITLEASGDSYSTIFDLPVSTDSESCEVNSSTRLSNHASMANKAALLITAVGMFAKSRVDNNKQRVDDTAAVAKQQKLMI